MSHHLANQAVNYARFLMAVDAETAPCSLLERGMQEAFVVLRPVAEANLNFLRSIEGVIRVDPFFHEHALPVVEFSLYLRRAQDELYILLNERVPQGDDGSAVIVKQAKAVQLWAYLAIETGQRCQALIAKIKTKNIEIAKALSAVSLSAASAAASA